MPPRSQPVGVRHIDTGKMQGGVADVDLGVGKLADRVQRKPGIRRWRDSQSGYSAACCGK